MSRVEHELILASAGSGKTFTIATRYIQLLVDGAAAEEIFASTFTRKAAGEIAQRIIVMLAQAALDDAERRKLATFIARPQLTQARCLELLGTLLQSLHRLNVGTLDSFFVRLAGAYALELGLGPGLRIAQDIVDLELKSEAIAAVLRESNADQLVKLIRRIDRGSAGRSVHDRLLDLVCSYHEVYEQTAGQGDDGHAAWHWASVPDQRVLTTEQIEELIEQVGGTDCPTTKDGRPNRNWQNALCDVMACARTGNWFSFIELSLVKKVIEGGDKYDRKDIPTDLRRCLEQMLAHAQVEILRALIEQADALWEMLRLYDREYRRLQQARSSYRFGDVTHALAGRGDERALAARQEIYYRLDARIRHVLLDEFQDTSLTQWQALEPVIDEVLSNREDRAALIVADPKQSIYGWRGGEPSLVEAVRLRYDLAPRPLKQSWRTSQHVLNVVNAVFERLEDNAVFHQPYDHETAARWREAFSRHEAAKDLPGYARIWAAPGKDMVLEHAAVVVRQVSAAAPGCSVGVLVRTNRAVRTLVDELRRVHGVAASEEGGNPLTDSPPVVAVLSLLRMADHPGDTVSRYHVACGPLGNVIGFTDWASDRAARALAHEVRRSLIVHGYGQTLHRWVERLAPHVDQRDLDRLMQLVELACRYEQQATIRPGGFVRLVEGTRVEDPAAACVRVMTVHQSKGLEFDIVVLAELDGIMGGGGAGDLMVWRDEPTGPVTRVMPYAGEAVRALLPQVAPVWEQHRARRMVDDLGVLYVAMTRARYALHAVIKPSSDSEKSGCPSVTATNLLRHGLYGGAAAAPGNDFYYESGQAGWYERLPVRPAEVTRRDDAEVPAELLKLATGPRRWLPRRAPSSEEGGTLVKLERLMSLRQEGRAFGSAAHRLFQQVEWLDNGAAEEALAAAAATDLDPAMLAHFRGWLEHETTRRLLGRANYPADAKDGGVQVLREHRFVLRTPTAIVKGSFDRLVLVKQGGRLTAAHIIDFKTDSVDSRNASMVDEAVKFYRPQMEAYRRAAAALFKLPPECIKATLLFVGPGLAREV